jgi:Ni,Fe-hydrogenase I small subunit
MKLMTLPQYMKMSKPALIRKIMKTLRVMPKKRLAMVCYNITKSKLPRLRTIKRKTLPYNGRIDKRRKRKRKFSRKQLAAQRLFAKRARAGTLRR